MIMAWRDIQRLGGEDILTDDDVRAIKKGVAKVLAIMSDGAWHTISELRERTAMQSADRRMRELRDIGYEVIRVRPTKGRTWFYRIDIEGVRPPALPAPGEVVEATPVKPPDGDVRYDAKCWNAAIRHNRMLLCELNRIRRACNQQPNTEGSWSFLLLRIRKICDQAMAASGMTDAAI